MKAGRNPRRAYDADGTMIAPALVADERAQCHKTVTAWCHGDGCSHSADIPIDSLPPELPVPDIALFLKLRCSRCGGRNIKVTLNVNEVYATVWGDEGYKGIGSLASA